MGYKPKLDLSIGGSSSGLTIYNTLDESYNCVEFATKAGTRQEILIAPWIQFESTKLGEKRMEIATEIVRRAMLHDALLLRIETLEMQLESYRQ